MRMRPWLLAAFGVLSIVYGVGLLLGSPLLPSAGVLAWLALLGYGILAARDQLPEPHVGRDQRSEPRAPQARTTARVRTVLLVGLLVLGVVALRDYLTNEGPSGPALLGWYPVEEPVRFPTNQGNLAYLSTERPSGFAAYRARLVEMALPALGYALIAGAVLIGPARARRRAALLGAAAGGGVALGYLALQLVANARAQFRGEMVTTTVAVVLAVGVSAATGAALARHTGWLPVLGLALITLTTFFELDRELEWGWPYALYDQVKRVTVTTAISTWNGSFPVGGVVKVLAQLAGPAAVTVGLLRDRVGGEPADVPRT